MLDFEDFEVCFVSDGKGSKNTPPPLESAHVFIGLILPSIKRRSLRGERLLPSS